MSQYRMGGAQYRPQKSRNRTRHKIIGVILLVVGVPMMVLLPFVFLGLPINGIGYLTGHGEKITVTIVDSSHSNPNGTEDAGKGHFTHEGQRKTVRLDQVDEGDNVSARIAITSDPGDTEPMAFASNWAAIKDTTWGVIFMLGSVFIGLGLYRAGRGLVSAS